MSEKRYRVEFHPLAEKAFGSLDRSLQIQVAKQLRKLEHSPELGAPCGNKAGFDLRGFRKLYVAKKSLRVIYRIHETKITVEVVSIGKRSELTDYREASQRKGN